MALPINPTEIYHAGKKFEDERARALSMLLVVDPLAEDDLIYEVRQAFVPMTVRARVATEVVEPGTPVSTPGYLDFAVVVLGPVASSDEGAGDPLTEQIRATIAELVERKVPVALVSRTGPRQALAARYGTGILDVIVGQAEDRVIDSVAVWCADNVADGRLALASNFEFARRSVALEYVKNTSLQNAVVGGVLFVPGADLPVMTLNQIKMVLQIAATYNQPLSSARIKEIAIVVGGAFFWRTIARQAIALIPVISIPIKATIGYTGTYAMGRAVVEYFEKGGSIVDLGPDLAKMKDRIATEADNMRQRMAAK